MGKTAIHLLLGIVAAIALGALALGPAAAKESGGKKSGLRERKAPVYVQPGLVAATLDGEPIALESLNSPEIAKARRKLYRLEQSLLRQKVLETLSRTKPKEFARPDVKISEEEIRQVYKRAGLEKKGTLDSFRGRIRAYLLRNRSAEIENELFAKAERKGYVKSYLSPPPAYLYKLRQVVRAGTRGPRHAPVHIVEFSDFQ